MVRPIPSMSEDGDLVVAMVREIQDTVRDIDVTLRGERGENGLVGRVGHLERTCQELRTALDAHTRLKYIPEEQSATIRAKAEAWAIRVGAGLGILGAIAEAYSRLNNGNLP